VEGAGAGPASCAHGYFIPAGDLAARHRASVKRKARLKADLVWVSEARADPPGFPPPAGPIPSWGHQHTSYVLKWLSECVAYALCPICVHAQ
jgi:hypothetical protein